MNTEDLNLTLDDFRGWRVDALRSYLTKRGLAGSHNKQELVALAFAAHTMKMPILPTTIEVEKSKLGSYQNLLLVDGENIPDPLTLFDKWANEEQGMKHWPPTFITDVTKFLLNYETVERAQVHLNQYQIGKAFEYYASNWMKEVFYHPISLSSKYCILKAQCTPSQSLNACDHTAWICIEKSTGSIKSAYCSCTSGLGQTCNHVAGLLFRVEGANKLGVTASTSSTCAWNVPSMDRKLQPSLLREMEFIKSTHGKEASRPLAAKSKKSFRVLPSIDMKEDAIRQALTSSLQSIVPNACIYKALPNTVTNTVVTMETEKEEMVLDVNNYTMAAMIENDVRQISGAEVAELNKITTGQAKNPNWVKLRNERITTSNFYSVHTKMESVKIGRKSCDVKPLVINSMGYKTVNPNIRALKYGRETEPIAKNIFKKMYQKKHKNVHFEECGIFIDKNHPYLGASPDLLVSCLCCGNGVVEFKCPLTQKCSVCQSFCICKIPPWMKMKPKLSLKTLCSYYGQVQGQMAITERRWCEFFVYTCNGNFSERIFFDSSFYFDMLQNLISFYEMYVLPEINQRAIQLELQSCSEEAMDVDEVESSGDIFFCPECRLQIQNEINHVRDRSICCDTCLLWFHFSCAGIRNSDLKTLSKWHCRICTSKNAEQ